MKGGHDFNNSTLKNSTLVQADFRDKHNKFTKTPNLSKIICLPKITSQKYLSILAAHGKNTSAKELHNDLWKISSWAYPWKMSFNQASS